MSSLGFASPIYRDRLDIFFRNVRPTDDGSLPVAEFTSRHRLTVCSFPDDIHKEHAKTVLCEALQAFADMEKTTPKSCGHNKIEALCARFEPPNRLTIVLRTQRFKRGKYRGDARFSNAFKPTGIASTERVVRTLEIDWSGAPG